MKKFVIASMVAIAMLVGIQPVFAEQFIAPEVSTSDSQCFVLDLPAGATAEAPEYAAPWQVPEVTEVTATTSFSDCWDFNTYLSGAHKTFNVGSCSTITVVVVNDHSSTISVSIDFLESSGTSVLYNSEQVDAYDTETFTYTSVPSNVRKVRVGVPFWSKGSVCVYAE
jgi:hypothetical protein